VTLNFQTTPSEKSKRWVWWIVAVGVLCLILTCCAAGIGGVYLYSTGQISLPFISKLDYQAVPLNGQVSLDASFVSDPYMASISTGGSLVVPVPERGINVSKLNLAGGCSGFASKEPTFKLDWSKISSDLRIFFVADSGQAALVIRSPDGNWFCNDNYAANLDPLVDFQNPAEGQYAIWVTDLAKGISATGTLYITELGYTPDDLPGAAGSTSLDPTASPNYGEMELTAGFTPDPNSLLLTSGGSLDVGTLNLGSGCAGYVTSQPDLQLKWSGGASATSLRIFFVADDGSDTTLIVNTPAGDWLCNNDSSYGHDPVVNIDYANPGSYYVWVGTSDQPFSSGTLYFTQSDYNPGNIANSSGSDTLDYTLASSFGSTGFGDASIPDPYSIDLIGGGSVDVSSLFLGPDCTGFAATPPDFRIDYTGSVSRLRVFFVASDGSNPTLIINTAGGNWFCNNDDPLSGTTNPMVEFSPPQTGTYDVWVGTYGSSNFTSGTLYITGLDYTPSHLP